MITIGFAGWISGRIVSFQPDADLQKLFSSRSRIRISISDQNRFNRFFEESGCEMNFGHFLPGESGKLHNHLFIIFGFESIFSALCSMPPTLPTLY